VRFRIFYADGSAFGSDQGTWDEAPLDGVVLVAIKDGERVERHTGADYYALLGDPGETIAATSDINPLLREHVKWIKHGVWTSHSNYNRIVKRSRKEF
jgi:hypothetical protein